MKYVIDEKVVESSDINMSELLAILLIKTGVNIPTLFEEMEKKELVVKDMFNNYLITQRWDDIASTVLLDGDSNKSKDNIEELAVKIMEVFPKIKKPGTPYYFRGNKKDNTLRLKKFFKLYGDKYTDEQIVQAAKKYVSSYNGNYDYMRILKYFIWKDQRKVDSDGNGYIEETSDLATYIDNMDAEDFNRDWSIELK